MECILNIIAKVFLVILIIPMGIIVTVVAGEYLTTFKDFAIVISLFLILMYFFIVLARLAAPVSVSKKLKKIIEKRLLCNIEKK